MKAALPRAAAMVALLALGACATPAPETRVTRFHLGQPIAPGEVVVEPLVAADAGSIEFGTYADAVGRELGRLGFRVQPNLPRSELVATVNVARGTRATLAERSPVSVGIGGGSYGSGVGLGGGVSFPLGGRGRGREVTSTELAVQLKRRSDGTVIWEGRAQTAARAESPAADPAAAASQLASALFAGFPGESGRTVTLQ